ncbi:MAG: hypothetical protein RBS82_12470 [Syntrophales bacterium]|jgi:hypothetical protein|nr:hypothetical protein [Syntrophales bacterium]
MGYAILPLGPLQSVNDVVVEQGDITGGAALIIYYSSPGFACPTLAGVARLASRAGGGRLAGIG